MADPQKNPSRSIMIGSIVAAVLLMLIVVPFTIKGDKPVAVAAHDAESVEMRIQPVARFELQKAAAASDGKPRDGASIVAAVCGACHGAGVMGAPKTGDKAAWGARLAQGKETLYKSAIAGKNAMPPKGGAADLSEAEVKAAVDHLVSLAK